MFGCGLNYGLDLLLPLVAAEASLRIDLLYGGPCGRQFWLEGF